MTAKLLGAPSPPELHTYYTPGLSISSTIKGGKVKVTLNYALANFGSTTAGASTSGIYLSTDFTITSSDTLLTTDAVAAIAPASSSTESVSFSIPSSFAIGRYYVGVILDVGNAVAESNETNNSSNGANLFYALPDLRITYGPTPSRSLFAAGATFNLTYTVSNYAANADPSICGIYLSTDNKITSLDTLLATDSIGTVASYFNADRSLSVTLPADIAIGNYYIGVIADYDNALAERDEANNFAPAAGITIAAPQADLSIPYGWPVLGSSSVSRGESVTFTYSVQNYGTVAAGPSVTGIYLSTDSIITASDTLLAIDPVAEVAAGSSSAESVSVIIPATLDTGYYYIGAIVDYGNAFSERSETNNSSRSVALTVTSPPLPDLDPSLNALTAGNTAQKGKPFTLDYKVYNYGNAAAGTSTSGIYLSTDGAITTSDTLLTTDAVAAIAAGSSSSESVSVTIPGALATGTYYIGVIADYNNAIAERNETNNPSEKLTLKVIDPIPCDLALVDVPALDGAWVLKGGTAVLTYRISNLVPDWSGPSVTGIYLSTDSTITTSDALLTTDMAFTYSSGTWSSEKVNVVIPDTIAAGKYYIGVIADYANALAEKNEGNNASAGVVLNVIATDDYAASTSTTGAVAVGGSTTGSIEKPYDVDWFRADLLGGVTYAIDVKGASSGSGTLSDPAFTLYSSTGGSLSTIDKGGSGTDARYTGILGGDTGGTFYIGVKHAASGYLDAGAGSYVVSVAVAQDDYAANLGTTGGLAVGGAASGNIEVAGDGDYFRVQLVAGTVYEFDLKGASSGGGTLVDPTLMLHDANNTSLRWDNNGGRAYLGSSTDAQIVYIPQESGTYYLRAAGSGSATGSYQLTAKTLSSDYYIQGILDQPNVRWNAGAPVGTAVNVTYSFPTTLPPEYSPDDIRGYRSFSASQKAAAVQALTLISTYANVTFTEVGGSDGQVRFGTCFQGNVLSGVTIPYTSGDALTRADVALANEYPPNSNLSVGTTGYVTLIHEIGHALGLKHPGDYNAIGAPPTPPYLPTSQDARVFTVETYNDIEMPVKSLMPFDIAALQYLYGANLATQGGNDNYTLAAGSAYSIWDSAGNDTLNAATLMGTVTLDLNPGSVSYYGYGSSGMALSPIAAIAFGSTIENAAGGSASDKLLGNAADNRLTGNGGDDRIDGGAGIDVAVYAGKRSNYTLADTGDPARGFTVAAKTGTEGTDNLFDVERLKFADTSVALDLAGNAGNAAKIIGALYGKQHLTTKEYVGAELRMLDSGQSMEQAAQVILNAGMFKQLAGSGSNTDFVKLVYKNVVGTAPGASDLDYFVHLLDSGAYSQASLAVAAAEDDFNRISIDLVGLAQTGIEYA